MDQQGTPGPIIGSVYERKAGLGFSASEAPAGTTSTGFPSVQHRSKSTFARSREENLRKNLGTSRLQAPPPVSTTASRTKEAPFAPSELGPEDPLRESINKENEARIAGMSPEEIEEERKHILERFGAGIGGVLEKARRNRMKKIPDAAFQRNGAASLPPPLLDDEVSKHALRELIEIPISPEERIFDRVSRSPPPSALASRPGSRPSSRASRRLRFAELDPQDVFVYESLPPSPRRVLALPAPSSADDDAISLGTWHGRMAQAPMPAVQQGTTATKDSATNEYEKQCPAETIENDGEVEEGTPEYIRRRFFPHVPANDPNLAWMSQSKEVIDAIPSTALRFDLRGNPIPPALSSQLATNLGLHHHAEGSLAGYTLDDIFLLSRSTVPAQRAIMFDILSGITQLLSKLKGGESVPNIDELKGHEEDLRKRIVAAGVEAMNERGSVGLRSLELVWQCSVGWDRKLIALGMQGVWLESAAGQSMQSLALDFVLPLFSEMFNRNPGAFPHEYLVQVLEIVQRLALESKENARKVVEEDNLMSGIVGYFLLAPYTQSEGLHLPEPEAINLLNFLARTSRPIAESLSRAFSDDILRFVAILPDSSPFPPSLAITLLTSSLNFYATLGNYGLCTHVPSTAMGQITRLTQYASSNPSMLSSAWARLAGVWVTCAVDPHVTTPPHDITWSRISAWGWQTDMLALLDGTGIGVHSDRIIWGDAWGTLGAWLEGAKVNGVRGGEKERGDLLPVVKKSFEYSGRAFVVVSAVLDSLSAEFESKETINHQIKEMAESAGVLANAIRLWLAFVPPHVEGPPDVPPFDLPFDRISAVAASLLSSPVWSIAAPSKSNNHPPEHHYWTVYLRHLSALLATYLSLSRRLPAATKDLWLAQAFSLVLRLMPGDEDAATSIINEVLHVLHDSPEQPTVASLILKPFMQEIVLARAKGGDGDDEEATQDSLRTRLGPLAITPLSIPSTTTTVLISPFAGPNSQSQYSGLPLHRDWTLSSMDHLLHSGNSAVFRRLPAAWDASEVEVVRKSFAFALASRDILDRFKLGKYTMDKNEAVLGCMKVFMLEHGLEKDAVTSTEEVFRDKTVETLMEGLLEPYRVGSLARPTHAEEDDPDLEVVASRFLGAGTPFYQFYTDFVGLYDAISFSHPLFALLLLPPLSMRYAIDYRKLFWSDYPQILRTIGTCSNEILSGNLREYLYPVEKDPQVIGALISGLVKNGAKEFLYWVAVHHIAANIWVDLRDEEVDGKFNEERAVALLKAVVDQGGNEVVAQVARYWQERQGSAVRVPPNCSNAGQRVLARRKQWIGEAVGRTYAERLGGVLVAT